MALHHIKAGSIASRRIGHFPVVYGGLLTRRGWQRWRKGLGRAVFIMVTYALYRFFRQLISDIEMGGENGDIFNE